MPPSAFATPLLEAVVAVVAAVQIAVYPARHRLHPPDVYVPRASWLRAGIYFCACYRVAIATGVNDPYLRAAHLPR